MKLQIANSAKRGSFRRWMQFRISTLFVVTTLAAVSLWSARVWWTAQCQRQIVQSFPTETDSFGRPDVEIIYDFEREGRKEPRFAPKWLVNAVGVDCFANVVALRTHSSGLPPEARGAAMFAKLSRLPELEEVSLFLDGIDNDVALLRHHKKLSELRLVFSGVTGTGLKEFASQQQIRLLTLKGCSATDDGLAVISTFENLQELDIGTDAYGGCPRRYSREGLKHLVGLRKLKKLNLWGADLTDEELAEVAKLQSLEHLVFWGRRATGKGILRLKTLSNLRYLDVDLTKETSVGEGELEKVLVSLAALKDAATLEQ